MFAVRLFGVCLVYFFCSFVCWVLDVRFLTLGTLAFVIGLLPCNKSDKIVSENISVSEFEILCNIYLSPT